MSYQLTAVLSLSVALPCVLGWVRFYKADPAYLPVVVLFSIALLNEIASIILIRYGYSNASFNNVYSLYEALFITWQMQNWHVFKRQSGIAWLLAAAFTAVWIFEAVNRGGIDVFLSGYNIVYALAIILLSLRIINRRISCPYVDYWKDPVFLFALGFVLYFVFEALTEIFWFYGLGISAGFQRLVFSLHSIINLICNLIYFYAVIWIPLKPKYIKQL